MRAWILLAAALLPVRGEDPFAAQREMMVREQIQARGVRNPDVLAAMRQVPRHLFVPEQVRSLAYRDHPLPIGAGQTISQPYIVALMSELLQVRKSDRVLEIGTGSGYQAAVLARLAKHVYSMELVESLAESARKTLIAGGYTNVTVRQGDGYLGWPEEAPFDRIILTAAPPEVPPALIDQLRPGGILVAPVGSGAFGQDLIVIEKAADGKLRRRSVIPVMFVPMVKK
jgi:protein-L-isoaspartate(D-aspartate) O-methyltransferase